MSKFSDEQIQGILKGRRLIGRFPFPGSEGGVEVGVRLLTDYEIDTARFNAQHYLDGRCKRAGISMETFSRVDPEGLDREHMRQVIALAYVDPNSEPEKPTRFFDDPDQVRKMDSVLVQQMWESYLDWQDTVNPRLRLSEDDQEQLIDALKKKETSKALLAHIARDTLTSLVRTLANPPST